MPRRIQVEIIGDSRSVERAFGRAGRAGDSFASSVGGASKRIARNVAAVGAAAAAVGVATSRMFAPFEESLSQIVGLAGGTEEAVERMGRQILRLGPEIGKSPQELAETLYFVASAGVAVSDQMEVVERSGKAAAAGLGQTQTVADAVSSAMNAYGASVVDAARATDVLVNTVRFGKGEAESFAPVIGTVAAIAAELGVAFEEVGAALAAQTRLGISAETAAIQLQATFSSLLKTAPKAEKALDAVGLSSEGLRKQLREKGLLSVLTTLRESFAGNTAAMAQAFPNIRALRGLLVLVGKNAASTKEVFDGMKDSTGALGVAFKAISEDEAFKFRQTLASLQAVGIRLGGLFAPVATKIAQGTTAALNVVNDFLEALGGAKTIEARLDVVWEGIEGAARGATAALGDAIGLIDWGAVWAKARGIADGLQDQLEDVDWGFVGTEIGDAIADAVRVAIPAAKELGERVSDAIATIDFEQLGKSLGPGLAAAMASAFVTLLDPAFWVRNWDLALAIAVTAFGGPLARIAGKLGALLLRPFARIVPRLGGAISNAFETAGVAIGDAVARISARAGDLLFTAVAGIPRTIVRLLSNVGRLARVALQPLIAVVQNIFRRLGRIGQFVVKVLGIQAAINAIVGFGKRVVDVFSGLGGTIAQAFQGIWDAIKRQAIRAALDIIEPFTHIPGFLGGGTFRRLKEEWQGTLATMESDATTTTSNIQTAIDRIEGRRVTIEIATITTAVPGEGGARRPEAAPVPRGQQGRGQGSGARTGAAEEAAAEAEEASAAEADAANRAAAARAAAARATKAAAARAKKAAEEALNAFSDLMDAFSLKEDRAGLTKGFADNIRILRERREAIQERIRESGLTLALERELFETETRLAEARRSQADRLRAIRQGSQFEALGLTETGEKRTPGVGALSKRAANLKNMIKGTALDTSKTRAQLAQIAKVLSGAFGKVGRGVRAAILAALNDISSAFDDSTGGIAGEITRGGIRSTSKLVEGLGLSPEQIQEINRRNLGVENVNRAGAFGFAVPNLSVAGGGGALAKTAGPGININGPITVVADDPDEFLRKLQRKASRNSLQRRGVKGGSRLGGV